MVHYKKCYNKKSRILSPSIKPKIQYWITYQNLGNTKLYTTIHSNKFTSMQIFTHERKASKFLSFYVNISAKLSNI